MTSDGARVGANDGSNPSNVGAIPTAPANSATGSECSASQDGHPSSRGPTYIDDSTGIQVSEDWWPGMPHDTP